MIAGPPYDVAPSLSRVAAMSFASCSLVAAIVLVVMVGSLATQSSEKPTVGS
jgi:hypothetical protein